jgi:ribonuclease PH
MKRLVERGEMERIPLKDQVAAVSVGIVDGEFLLDLDFDEDLRAEVDMNVVMTGRGRLVEVQGTAEKRTFTRSELDRLLDLAWKGIQQILKIQREVLDLE